MAALAEEGAVGSKSCSTHHCLKTSCDCEVCLRMCWLPLNGISGLFFARVKNAASVDWRAMEPFCHRFVASIMFAELDFAPSTAVEFECCAPWLIAKRRVEHLD